MLNRVLIAIILWQGCDSSGGGGCTSPTSGGGSKPVIDEVRAVSSTVLAGDTTTVAGTARDLEGEQLDYVWTASAGTFQSANGNLTIVWMAPPLSTGNKTVTLRVVNESGKEATKSVTILVTNKPEPIVVIDVPSQGAFIPSSVGNVNIQSRITNTTDVDSAKCYINGSLIGKTTNIQNPQFVWSVSGLNGQYRITVQAWSDFAGQGQKTDSAVVNVNVEGTIGKPGPP